MIAIHRRASAWVIAGAVVAGVTCRRSAIAHIAVLSNRAGAAARYVVVASTIGLTAPSMRATSVVPRCACAGDCVA